jgi:peptidoglycan/xylan/chitin deacetylase (PgdA/CDA1 family)
MMDLLRQDVETWDLFTRKEEYGRCGLDRHDRFPFYRSCNRDLSVPRASRMLIEGGYHCEYPEAQPFAVCLTHDIDIVYRSFFSKGYQIAQALKDGDLSCAARTIPQLRSKKLPWWNFREIATLEESFGVGSSFYFLALEDGDLRYTYAIEDLEREMCMLHDRGYEIGLHGGCEAYHDLEALKREKRHLERVLNRSVAGYRNHFLKFRVPDTWELLEKAGFQYDTTLGYADCVGFRNGMCHPFRPFNLNTNRELEILEIPLVIMDMTLLSFMKLNMDQAWEHTEHLLNTVERHHGVITILWHNTNMAADEVRFYRKILKYCSARRAWMTSCREMAAWWEKNGMQAPPIMRYTMAELSRESPPVQMPQGILSASLSGRRPEE